MKTGKVSQKQAHHKSSKLGTGQVAVRFHDSVNVDLTGVNLRRVNISLIPNRFDMFLKYAELY